MSGNVAEWVVSPTVGTYSAQGGSAYPGIDSFEEMSIFNLVSCDSFEKLGVEKKRYDVGFRCCNIPN